jgi:quinol-cytochrome oxidoreductase complex cytochrome b subunit
MDIPWKLISLVMALLAMTASAIAIQDVRTQQTSQKSKWYQATIALLVISIAAILGILYGFYYEQQQQYIPVRGWNNRGRMNVEG